MSPTFGCASEFVSNSLTQPWNGLKQGIVSSELGLKSLSRILSTEFVSTLPSFFALIEIRDRLVLDAKGDADFLQNACVLVKARRIPSCEIGLALHVEDVRAAPVPLDALRFVRWCLLPMLPLRIKKVSDAMLPANLVTRFSQLVEMLKLVCDPLHR